MWSESYWSSSAALREYFDQLCTCCIYAIRECEIALPSRASTSSGVGDAQLLVRAFTLKYKVNGLDPPSAQARLPCIAYPQAIYRGSECLIVGGLPLDCGPPFPLSGEQSQVFQNGQ